MAPLVEFVALRVPSASLPFHTAMLTRLSLAIRVVMLRRRNTGSLPHSRLSAQSANRIPAWNGSEAEGTLHATNSTRGAMRGFVLGRSQAEPTKTRRVAQDCDPKTYMYMSSGRKDALIGRFSWASTVAPTVTAHWKANQHRASPSSQHPTRSRALLAKAATASPAV